MLTMHGYIARRNSGIHLRQCIGYFLTYRIYEFIVRQLAYILLLLCPFTAFSDKTKTVRTVKFHLQCGALHRKIPAPLPSLGILWTLLHYMVSKLISTTPIIFSPKTSIYNCAILKKHRLCLPPVILITDITVTRLKGINYFVNYFLHIRRVGLTFNTIN